MNEEMQALLDQVIALTDTEEFVRPMHAISEAISYLAEYLADFE